MPTKQSPTKGTAHSTPTKAKKPTSDQVTPIREAKGKGFFKPEATAMVREVLTNEPSDAKAAARLGVNRSTAYRLRKRLEKDLPLITPQVRTPPPSPDTQKRVQILKGLIEEHEACTCPELRDMLEHEHGIVVERTTVYRDVTEKLGLEFKLARAVPAKFDEEKRVAFAEEELKKDPDAVYYVFMDESWINATHRNKGRWVEQGAPRPDLKCRERHVPKVNTFALLCEDRLMCWDLPDGDGQKGGVTQPSSNSSSSNMSGPNPGIAPQRGPAIGR